MFTGTGSWARRKGIINGALRREELLDDLMEKFKRKFGELAEKLEDNVRDSVEEHLGVVDSTLDMVRDENVALESERDPAFRTRVADELRELKEAMERVLATVGGV